jgi:hypothetical protein
MTSTLPPEIRDVFERFISCEYTTVDSRQQPITWPVTPYYSQGGPTIDVTTGLGHPKKADDAKRNPRVSLFFSEPLGSGIQSGIRVLVQGTAEIDEENLAENRERLYVKVRPERVFVWPDGDHLAEPTLLDARVEEVRSGHAEAELEPHVPAAGGGIAWDERIDQLGERHPTAVLSWVAPDGFPLSARVKPRVDRAGRRVALGEAPVGFPVTEGLACLTAHAHGPNFEWQESFQVRGDLMRGEDGWELVPHKLIGGF